MSLFEKSRVYFSVYCKDAPFFRFIGYLFGLNTWDGKKRISWYGRLPDSEPKPIKNSTPTQSSPVILPSANPVPISQNPTKQTPNIVIGTTGLSGRGVTGLSGFTGSQGVTGIVSGFTGSQGVTGIVGVTGMGIGWTGWTGLGPLIISEDEWDNPTKTESINGTHYRVKGNLHCQFGPAIINKTGEKSWFIKGTRLDEKQIEKMKNLLSDIKSAPLYINDPIFKYTAKWVLKNGEMEKD